MATWEYKARTKDGKTVNSTIDGESKTSVVSKLRERGYFVTSITQKAEQKDLFAMIGWEVSIPQKSICIFARQFATMIGSGVPLVRCLSILHSQEENARFKKIIAEIRADVEGGVPFSGALEKHKDVFDRLFVNLVKAGEAGGILDQILQRLADYLEGSEQLKSKVKGALTYPVVVGGIAFLVVGFLVVFVLPSFKEIFDGMNAKLPLPTAILMGTSTFATKYFPVIIAAIIGGGIGFAKFLKTETGSNVKDRTMLKLPAFGPMLKKVAVSKFTRTLGTLINSGVPILEALEVTGKTAGNIVIEEAIDKVRKSIREGESIAEPLKQSGVFPNMVVQMISVGEETGELDTMLVKIADFYDSEVDEAVKGLTSVIEPLVIVFMGVVIGGIVMSIFLPMMNLVNMNH